MDKQKQMRDKLIKIIKKQSVCCNGNDCGKCYYDGDNCVEERLADAIIDSNAIIHEGAVVLTREELQAHDKALLEKTAERVKMAFYYEFDELIPSIMADKIDEICKEITEGDK